MKIEQLFRKKSIPRILHEAELNKEQRLSRSLNVRDLTFLGIAAIIGAGIFGTIGTAASNGGPAVSLLFIFTALACLFSAMCYAQFASGIPIAGSAYTYAYTSFGELIAWIIGWDLIMEYAIGNVTVAISWSDYFTSFLENPRIGFDFPDYFSVDYLSAYRSIEAYNNLKASDEISASLAEAYSAWRNAPMLFGIRIILDLPALLINVIITALVYIGIKESKRTNNTLVWLKLAIILLVIFAGITLVDTSNWDPFAPNKLSGVLQGVSAVFFAYIGFDAISTTAEEAVNPKKDLPKAMIFSLIISTLLYVIITLVLTGMVNYKLLGVGDPLAFAFEQSGLTFLPGIIAVGAIVAMTSVLLVFQLGQPRIWMSMSRDGLLPAKFSRIHPRFRTPSFATIVTGVIVGLPILFFNLEEVTDLTSIGTLFAFVIVCGGILINPPTHDVTSYRVPYYNSKYIIPTLYVGSWIVAIVYFNDELKAFFSYGSWESFSHKIPFIIYLFVALILSILCYTRKLSLIPVLGLLTNLYLMSQLEVVSWIRFLIWLVVGLVLYFCYSFWKSKLKNAPF